METGVIGVLWKMRISVQIVKIGDDIRTIEINADVLLNACKDISLAVNIGRTKYMETRLDQIKMGRSYSQNGVSRKPQKNNHGTEENISYHRIYKRGTSRQDKATVTRRAIVGLNRGMKEKKKLERYELSFLQFI